MLAPLIIFLFFLLFYVFIPGICFLHLGKIKTDNILIGTGLAGCTGLVLLISLLMPAKIIRFPDFIIYLYPFIFAFPYLIFRKKSQKKDVLNVVRILNSTGAVLLLIMVSSLIQSYTLFSGGVKTDAGIRFHSVHDNLWNISIINELKIKVPPDHPAISGEVVKNHHYFYLYFLALANKITAISVFDLYFRFGPVFVSFLYGLSLYSAAAIFTKKVLFRAVAVFLGYFSGNLAYLAPLFFSNITDWRANLFFADQPFDQIFNPYTVLGFAVFLYAAYSLSFFLRQKKPGYIWPLIISLFIAGSFGIKSFGSVILLGSLLFTATVSFIFFREKRLLYLSILSILLFLPVFYLIAGKSSISPVFIPGWLLREMMTGTDKLNQPVFSDIENYYISVNNLAGLIKIKLFELFIYILGNFGMRLLGFLFLMSIILSKKAVRLKITALFILTAVVLSISVPLLFNLSNSPYNIIQFTPYSLVLLSVASALFLEDLRDFLTAKKLGLMAYILILFLIISSLPVNIKNFSGKIREEGDIIGREDLEGAQFLKEKAGRQKIILIDPDQFPGSAIYLPALSGKKFYLADSGYALQTGISPEKKLALIRNFFDTGMTDRSFLDKNNIEYIYLKNGGHPFVLFDPSTGLTDNMYRTVFTNGSITILQLK